MGLTGSALWRAADAALNFLTTAVSRIENAILFSAIIHVMLIVGLTPTLPVNPKLFENPNPPLDVVLVNKRTKGKPLKPEYLAQANLNGGGDVESEHHARSPLPASAEDRPAIGEAEQSPPVQAPEQETKAVMQRSKSDYSMPGVRPPPSVQPSPPQPVPAPPNLAARSLEMARLAASIDREWDQYEKRPRRMFVGARAVEFTFARYVEDWRIKVERIGNLNYPADARRNHLYGSLILTVSINSDGTVDSIQIDRSSGSRVLDAAAVNIVKLAAPYAPFPPEMSKKVDILGITRTWTFTRSDELTSQ